MLHRIKWQIGLALFWFISAYLAVGALLPWSWAWNCAWINVILGLVGLLIVTRTELGERLFYEGPQGDEPGLLQIGCLWLIPAVGLVLTSVWWLMRWLGFYNW